MRTSFDPARRHLLALGCLGLGALASAPVRALAGASASSSRSKLILLGTAGGPTPKPSRAAPANAVVIDDAVYIVDCGNGVARQMALAGLSLGSIADVFITHHHSDHDADYGNLLLLAWASDLTHPVDTWGPPPLAQMTRLFLRMDAEDTRVRMADEGRPPLAPLIRPHEISRGGPVMQDARVKVTAAVVHHPLVRTSLAYRFDCPDRSIVFSGDTRPCDALVELAHGADVLVHEVMYLPALDKLIAREPNAKRLRQHLLDSHTTTAQVGDVATRAGVKMLVLTHFVPGGDPALTDSVWRDAVAPHFKGEIVVGRDLMVL